VEKQNQPSKRHAQAVAVVAVTPIYTDQWILRAAELNIAQQMDLQYRNVWYIYLINSGVTLMEEGILRAQKYSAIIQAGARSSVAVKGLGYKPEGRRFDTR
jgi:hypothetical protein